MPLPRCVRVDASDLSSRQALIEEGWREVEILETWERQPAEMESAIKVSHMGDGDRVPLKVLFTENMGPNRLVTDGFQAPAAKLREKIVDETPTENIFGVYIRQKLSGACIVRPEGNRLRILLIASSAKREGVGTSLLRFVIGASHKKFETIVAGTQADNLPARCMYEANGFRVVSRERTFHK